MGVAFKNDVERRWDVIQRPGEGARRLRRCGHVPGAREIAARVLVRVWEEDAFAAAALDAELASAPPARPARRGRSRPSSSTACCAPRRLLDERIAAPRDAAAAPRDAGACARTCSWAPTSCCFLDRVPAFAAVSEAVDGVTRRAEPARRRLRQRGAAQARGRAVEAKRPPRARATRSPASAPGWLRGSLRRSLGRGARRGVPRRGPGAAADRALPRARAKTATPGSRGCARPRRGATSSRGAVLAARDRWCAAPATRAACPGARRRVDRPGGGRAGGGARARREAGRARARRVRRPRQQGVARSPSGSAPGGAVDAADLYPTKLDGSCGAAPAQLRRARPSRSTGRWARGEVPGGYDRVLVDAPCSGTGRCAAAPRSRGADEPRTWRVSPRSRSPSCAAPRRACATAERRLSVCSVLREEAEDVVRGAAA